MVSPTTENGTLAAYDAIAPLYDEYSKKRQIYLESIDQLVIQNIKPNQRLLDVGSGDGRRLAKIKNAVELKEIVAIEPSTEMSKLCEKRLKISVHKIFAENISELKIGQFDIITVLWNVLGHINSSALRLKALKGMCSKLNPDGIIILDVNNRHNATSYGHLKVFVRVIIDKLNFKESRGDASYEWKIGQQSFQASGHLFTPEEIENLTRVSGLEIEQRLSVDYSTGATSKSKYRGQLFYILKKTGL